MSGPCIHFFLLILVPLLLPLLPISNQILSGILGYVDRVSYAMILSVSCWAKKIIAFWAEVNCVFCLRDLLSFNKALEVPFLVIDDLVDFDKGPLA